jgi:hypothetical protein
MARASKSKRKRAPKSVLKLPDLVGNLLIKGSEYPFKTR